MQATQTHADTPTVSKVPFWCLLAIIIQADLLLWLTAPGLGVVATFAGIAAAIHFVHQNRISTRRAINAWGVLAASLIPAIDLVQPLSIMFAILGLGAFACFVLALSLDQVGRVLRRLWLWAVPLAIVDMTNAFASGRTRGPLAPRSLLQDWMMPLGLGLVFLSLFVSANPVISHWLDAILTGRFNILPDLGRVIFWAGLALLVWPFLRLPALETRLTAAPWPVPRRARGVLVNDRSVTRALVLFNLLFAVQTASDLAILTGGVALPEGITYATYAHQGAYPLVATALLAGAFGVVAQPWLGGRPTLRLLLVFWVAQNVLLVATSAMRLDLYVDTYGLTRLRFAAFVWMGLVAAGLSLMIWQILRALPVGWMLNRAIIMGLAALYVCSLINVAGLVAGHNLDSDRAEHDSYHLCYLGEGAVPAIIAHQRRTGVTYCHSFTPRVSTPADWREWGYRNARLRSSVAALTEGTN